MLGHSQGRGRGCSGSALISVGVVAHSQRYQAADKLSRFTGAEVVMVDEGGSLGCNANHLRTMEWLHNYPAPGVVVNENSWVVVLEDDAIPCNNFRNELCMALNVAPSPVVSLYLGRAKPEHWQEPIARVAAAECSWLMATDMLHAVGYAIKRSLAQEFMEEVPGLTHNGRELPIDEAISKWCRTAGYKVAYSHPSLVNHNDGVPIITDAERSTKVTYLDPSPQLPSGTQRVAWVWGTRDRVYHKRWDRTAREILSPTVIHA